jgi:hypothetical protein
MPRNCTVVANCIDCPAIPATPSQSAQVTVSNVLGWNAGANLVAQHDGAVRVIFSATPPTLGLILGFKSARNFVTSPSRVAFGFYLTSVSGLPFFSVIESGVKKTSNARWFDSDDVFRIQRTGGVVSYFFNDLRVYASETRSNGPLIVNACLYAAGDSVQ